jgi:hypothetical protein
MNSESEVAMKRNGRLIALLLTVALCGVNSSASGDDTMPPLWRGNAGSTMQHWQLSSSGSGNFLPEIINNPYAPPTPTLALQLPYTWQPTYMGRSGVLVKPAGATPTYLQCGVGTDNAEIPNAATPGYRKDVYIQLTYYQNSPTRIEIFEGVAPFHYYSFSQLVPVARIDRGGGWFTDVYNFPLDACLVNETVEIWWDPNPGFAVDQVVIDTRCYEDPQIPTLSEWGVIILALIVIGGGILVLRRRPPAPTAA